MSFPSEAARDVLGLLRAMWATEEDPHRRHDLAAAGHQVSQALQLAATNPEQAQAMVNQALRSVQNSMKYFEAFAPIFNVAVERVRRG